jgi:signal transduction histidine kinase
VAPSFASSLFLLFAKLGKLELLVGTSFGQLLLTNAIKFSPSNSTIILAIEETDNSTKFVVKDHGNSIDKNDIPTLFEKFTQARNEGLSKPSGFGLGLAICKDIIERHSGTIGVISDIGQGSTFWLTLPKQPSEAYHPVPKQQ